MSHFLLLYTDLLRIILLYCVVWNDVFLYNSLSSSISLAQKHFSRIIDDKIGVSVVVLK